MSFTLFSSITIYSSIKTDLIRLVNIKIPAPLSNSIIKEQKSNEKKKNVEIKNKLSVIKSTMSGNSLMQHLKLHYVKSYSNDNGEDVS